MHTYRSGKPSSGPSSSSQPLPSGPGRDEDHEENDAFPQPEGDGEGGYSYAPGARTPDASSMPLVTRGSFDNGDVIFDGGDQDTAQNGSGELVPYAHRDLKPG